MRQAVPAVSCPPSPEAPFGFIPRRSSRRNIFTSKTAPKTSHISTMAFAWKASGITYVWKPIAISRHPPVVCTNRSANSYNRYLAVAARVVRRSLKEDKRLQAERRGEMDLRMAKWEVGDTLVLSWGHWLLWQGEAHGRHGTV